MDRGVAIPFVYPVSKTRVGEKKTTVGLAAELLKLGEPLSSYAGLAVNAGTGHAAIEEEVVGPWSAFDWWRSATQSLFHICTAAVENRYHEGALSFGNCAKLLVKTIAVLCFGVGVQHRECVFIKLAMACVVDEYKRFLAGLLVCYEFDHDCFDSVVNLIVILIRKRYDLVFSGAEVDFQLVFHIQHVLHRRTDVLRLVRLIYIDSVDLKLPQLVVLFVAYDHENPALCIVV